MLKLYEFFNDAKLRLFSLSIYNKFRISGLFVLDMNVYNILGDSFKTLLDKSIEFKDYETARFTMILSQTFYTLQNKEKISLQNKIESHNIWTKIDFWEDFFRCTLKYNFRLLIRRNTQTFRCRKRCK
jgi:hypothetical protein